MRYTDRQIEVIEQIENFKHIHLRGGSRSGKTFLLTSLIAQRANNVRSRHLIGRKYLTHIRSSIILDTFPKVMEELKIKYELKDNKAYAELNNESQIWFHGFDDKVRTEKILGNEYSTVYYNEISEMEYQTILIGLADWLKIQH